MHIYIILVAYLGVTPVYNNVLYTETKIIMKFQVVALALATIFASGADAQGGCYGSGLSL